MKALQVKLVDLETQSFANSPRPAAAKRLATTMAELQAKYDREVEEKLALLDQYRQVERAAKEMRARIEEISLDRGTARPVSEVPEGVGVSRPHKLSDMR
jgi:myosin protein heavy chain